MKYLMKNLLIIALITSLCTICFAETTVIIIEIDPEMTLEEIETNIAMYQGAIKDNVRAIEALNGFMYGEYLTQKEEYEVNCAMLKYYEAKLIAFKAKQELYWEEKTQQYPVATKIWRYLTEELGYNEYVSAGIIGNMMVESGGHTLDIDPYNWDDATGRSFYGICQWGYYFPEVKNQNLDFQLDFLRDTIEEEFSIGGYSLEKFLSLTDEREAAKVFCRAYERPGPGYEYPRLGCAEVAYDFFMAN